MVVQGSFAFSIIDAESQQPLNEYRGPSGSVYYAEAKPGGEYFLRFQVLQDEFKGEGADKGSKQQETMMYFRPAVDGKDLGFYTNLTKSQGARDVGLWTYVNGVGTNQALKFETAAAAAPGDKATSTSSVLNGPAGSSSATAASDAESSSSPKAPPRLYMGNVQVQISKGVFTGYQKRVSTTLVSLTKEETVVAETPAPISASSSLQEEEEETNANAPTDPSVGSSNKTDGSPMMEPVPVLRSGEGAAKFQHKFAEECPTYQPGELLETITIHYGSTAALVQAGILVPIHGMVPQYVGVPPPTRRVTPAAASTNTAPTAAPASQEKVVVPNPLLDVSSSAVPRPSSSGIKRPQESGKGSTTDEPAPKKPCHQPVAQEPAVVATSAAVSTK